MSKYKVYFALEKQVKDQGHDVSSSEIIKQFTDDEKSSLKELTPTEYKELLNWLKRAFKLEQKDNGWQSSPENRMRRKVYSLFVYKMNYTPEGMNQWCIKYGKFRKPLKEHNENELVQLVTQAEKVYQSYLVEINRT